jgi:hypothetical protein
MIEAIIEGGEHGSEGNFLVFRDRESAETELMKRLDQQ